MKAVVQSLAVMLLLTASTSSSSNQVEAKRLKKTFLADIDVNDLYSSTEKEDTQMEINVAK